MPTPFLQAVLTAAGVVATAVAMFYITRHQGAHDYTRDMAEIVQALEAGATQLRNDLTRVTTHRDQLMVENIELMKQVLNLKRKVNGNGKSSSASQT